MNVIDMIVAVFAANMITVAWAYSMNHIIKASNEGRKQSFLALWGAAGPMLLAAAYIATV
jgi:hypothetical protein